MAGTGDLDPSFGSGGLVVGTDFGGLGGRGVWKTLVQADGRIIAVGVMNGAFGNGDGFAIARLDPNGSLDPTFGSGGTVVRTYGLNMGVTPGAELDSDGRLTVMTTGVNADPADGVFLARFMTDGTLDHTFGVGGEVVTADFRGISLVLLSDGKVVVSGSTTGPGSRDGALIRYDPTGALDSTFGVDGVVLIPSFNFIGEMVLQPDGKLVANVGEGIVRFNGDGSIDTTFGMNGISPRPVSPGNCPSMSISNLALDSAGGFIVGLSHCGDLAMLRLSANGVLDGDFGTGGFAITDVDSHVVDDERVFDVLADPAGRILVAGSTGQGSYLEDSDFVVARYAADGQLDRTFGAGGTVLFDIDGGLESATALAVQADGDIIVGGVTRSAGTRGFAIARLQGSCPASPDADGDGLGDACDPCTSPGAVSRPVLDVRRMQAPVGDDILKVSGVAAIAAAPPIDLVESGFRFILQDAGGAVLLDASVLGDAADAVGLRNWRRNANGTKFSFQPDLQQVAADGQIARMVAKVLAPGEVRFKVKGKRGTYPFAGAILPMSATIVFNAVRADDGRCALATFSGSPPRVCELNSGATVIKCR